MHEVAKAKLKGAVFKHMPQVWRNPPNQMEGELYTLLRREFNYTEDQDFRRVFSGGFANCTYRHPLVWTEVLEMAREWMESRGYIREDGTVALDPLTSMQTSVVDLQSLTDQMTFLVQESERFVQPKLTTLEEILSK